MPRDAKPAAMALDLGVELAIAPAPAVADQRFVLRPRGDGALEQAVQAARPVDEAGDDPA